MTDEKYSLTEWIEADELPPRNVTVNWHKKLKEFLDGSYDIAYLQAKDKRELIRFYSGLRHARIKMKISKDELKISRNCNQMRIYVAKRQKEEK